MAIKRQVLVVAAAVIVGLGALVLIVRNRQAEAPAVATQATPQAPAAVDTTPTQPEAQQEPTEPAASSTAPETKPPVAQSPRKPQVLAEQAGVQIGEWNAKTQEEVDWLNANLYPTKEESHAAAYPEDLPADLVPRSARDLAAAENLLGQKQLSERDRERARATLLNGAADGYVYAFIAIGMALEPTSPAEAQAYFRAALFLGDWSVAFRARPQLPYKAEVAASLLAHQMLVEADSMRAQRGLPPLARQVRPGLDPMLATLVYAMEAEAAGGGAAPPP